MDTILAHRTEDGREQTLEEHLLGTAQRAADFAGPFGAADAARIAALGHDLGKGSAAFQRRIRGAKLRADHSTAGAQALFRLPLAHVKRGERPDPQDARTCLLLAYCAAGHHGGLPDGGSPADLPTETTLLARLRRGTEPPEPGTPALPGERPALRAPRRLGNGGFTEAFWTRMVFSCLVDADFLDTETFMQGEQPRGGGADIPALLARFEEKISEIALREGALNRVRGEILRACRAAGECLAPGLFTLTVPTGGGKTLSSMAFALHHAKTYGKRRVVYVIPYTSIIEQTADVFRAYLGDENVLEHHSNVDLDGPDGGDGADPARVKKRLAAENWDAPVIVTTAVQFFESLFSNRPWRCRKLHSLAESVIVFDEAQTLPLPFLTPCVRAIAELTVNYGASCVLCTATQPALGPLFAGLDPALAPREIAPPVETEVFRRVRYESLGSLSDEALAERLSAHEQALCIVPTRAAAQNVFELLPDDSKFHLSTRMTPEHRRRVLAEIKRRTQNGLPCRVVATSLVEAGVDLDFPVVYRAEAGLDSVIQAAGRCNREGKRPASESLVYVYAPEAKYNAHLPHAMRLPVECMREAVRGRDTFDDPETVERYFRKLRAYAGPALDSADILPLFEGGAASGSYGFAEAARKFRLISDGESVTVLVPRSEEAKALAERLKTGERGRDLLRKAGQFSVSVFLPDLAKLPVEQLENDLFLLLDESLYRETTGLVLPDGGSIAIMI